MSTPTTILNVEDIPENRHLVRRILESEGYRVVDAPTALDGIEKAIEIRPDLILMDINLPDIDGFSAVTRIRSYPELSKVPILALTARSISDDRERAKAIGCDGYLSKPIQFEELTGAVRRHLNIERTESEQLTKREYYLKEQNVTLIDELERKLSELKTAYDRLRHFEEAKSNFISVASHELRTPLTVIHSYTQMLQMLPSIKADPNSQELLDGINNGVKRLQEIMSDMVSVIRVELADQSLTFSPVSIRSVINSVATEQKQAMQERQLQISILVDNDLPMVLGDFKQLHSALGRIIGNAVKYTPDEGRIQITAQLLRDESSPGAPFIEVIIADSGVGIAQEKQKMIFEKFSTAADVSLHSTSKSNFMGGGAGLGLTIAKGVIDAHNGRIWVESEGYDKEKLPGSKFFILLPTQ